MPTELTSTFISLGVGGVIALLVLYWKREDDKKNAETLAGIITRLEAREERALRLVESSVQTQTTLNLTVGQLVVTVGDLARQLPSTALAPH